jgi:Rrf2 family iron-sulfur cluster assembly transcriptional regulator
MFTMEVQQALRALVALAGADGPLVLDALAREAKAPAPALAKILSRLARLGLVVGQRGPGGGYRLARAADDIRLADVVMPIEGTTFARTCLFGLPHCSDEAPCPLHLTWGAMRNGLLDMLENETLASLVARSAKPTNGIRNGAGKRARIARARAAATKRNVR